MAFLFDLIAFWGDGLKSGARNPEHRNVHHHHQHHHHGVYYTKKFAVMRDSPELIPFP